MTRYRSSSEHRERRGLVRSRNERWLAGVCGGVADFYGLSPGAVRALWVLFSLLPGPLWLVYAALWILLPEDYT